MNKLILLRGVPGSGKSTRARELVADHCICEADKFFTDDSGSYNFDAEQLPEAHSECLSNCIGLMCKRKPVVVVANTFIQKDQMDVYKTAAGCYGYSVEIEVLDGGYESVHNVPAEVVNTMRDSFEL